MPMATFSHDVLIVGGFGHVGLPLGIALAQSGCKVLLLDIDQSKRPMIERGEMPFMDEGADEALKGVIGKNLTIADSIADIAKAEAIIVTIGTPVDEYLNPKVLPVLKVCESLLPHLTNDHLVVLRSTIYPGTMQQLQRFFAKKGTQPDLAYCPERIVQGQAMRELKTLPQVVSGVSDQAVTRAEHLFQKLGVETVVVSEKEAELTKLFLNAWRYIHFATANQFYTITRDAGADFDKVYHAMTYKYDRAKTFPRPGFAAGPCLLKDTMQIAAFARSGFPLGRAAMTVNEGLPQFLIEELAADVDLSTQTVGILGMAFKADSDDNRDSLSYKVGKLLRFHGANVLYSDEFVKDPTFTTKEDLVERSDIIILGVPHSAYKGLKIPRGKRLVDIWGFFPQSA